MIMFRIREVTIKFSGTRKRKVENLESNENQHDIPTIETKKEQLLELWRSKMRGKAVRS